MELDINVVITILLMMGLFNIILSIVILVQNKEKKPKSFVLKEDIRKKKPMLSETHY